jgi:putative membrane-bound dehydrogenase-like protein
MLRAALFLLLCGSIGLATSDDKPVPVPVPVTPAGYQRVSIGKHTFTLPVGFTIELAAATPLVDRPITAAFDDRGRLFVADSSGSNAKPTDQLKDPTNRIVMLESSKNDGKFDTSTVFADKLSFLQGTMWHSGSLYVSTPPTIQKLTDTDGDAKADKREVWFNGQALTFCANDVHGPYPGPDGRFYFTKGAFAKQELMLGTGKKFTTQAAHIYSAKPDGSDLRVEMTGGMDNPVDVAFNTTGEMFFTTTFFQHPANGKRDGIVHATYGAVYGKDHDPVHQHIRTRPEFNEPLTHLGPAAPSGLHCYRSGAFGAEYRDNLFACQFNMSKVSRHILKEKGSAYSTIDSDFVTSENRDFHPTDLIEDADGSLLILDTGGWYKLCCPSSVFEKKELLGGIYRVRKTDAVKNPAVQTEQKPRDIRLTSDSLADRRIAAERMARGKELNATAELLIALADNKNDAVLNTALTRALIDIGDAKATAAGLKNNSLVVQRAALAALDAMPGGNLSANEVTPYLLNANNELRETAWWIASKHPNWGDQMVGFFRERLERKQWDAEMSTQLARYASNPAVQKMMAEVLTQTDSAIGGYLCSAIKQSRLKSLPVIWEEPLIQALSGRQFPSVALQTLGSIPVSAEKYRSIVDRARTKQKEAGAGWSDDFELDVVSNAPPGTFTLSDKIFAAAIKWTRSERPQYGITALGRSNLTLRQLEELASYLPEVSPLYLSDLLSAFTRSTDLEVGLRLVAVLRTPKLRAVVRVDQVKPIFDKYPKAVQEAATKLYADLEEATKEQRLKLDTILKDTKPGDRLRGQAVFSSTKAACSNCHKVHYVGGQVGPDMTKIGAIRSERDLLEAIVYPSASFVRSYEPVKVEMKDGRVYNGILKDSVPFETDRGNHEQLKRSGFLVVLQVNATDEVRLAQEEIEEITPGKVSVMPAGLDQQLTPQELADLVAFLKSLK